MTDDVDTAPDTAPYEFLTRENEISARSQSLRQPLRQIDLFENLSDADLTLVSRLSKEIEVSAGSQLMEQGETETELVLVMSGGLRIERDGEIIGRVPVGRHIGEISLLDGKPRVASVIAEEASRLLVIQKHTFDHLLTSSPGLKDSLLLGLCARIRRLQGEALG